MPVEELFFTLFSFTETDTFTTQIIYNQGEILNYMNIYTAIKPTKYDIRDIFIKNKIEYKNFKFNGHVKKGYRLFIKKLEEKEDVPF
jgi:hypothetical protein